MGILNLFARQSAALMPLPRGSFTVDREGRVLASTLPQAFPNHLAEDIAMEVLAAFRAAHVARVARRRHHFPGPANPLQPAQLED